MENNKSVVRSGGGGGERRKGVSVVKRCSKQLLDIPPFSHHIQSGEKTLKTIGTILPRASSSWTLGGGNINSPSKWNFSPDQGEVFRKKSISNNNDSDKIIEVKRARGEEFYIGGCHRILPFFSFTLSLLFSQRMGGRYIHPFCFIYPFGARRRAEPLSLRRQGVGMMKNLQNYAKNVQLVKRNIILCVASFYIASFPFLDWDNGGGRGFSWGKYTTTL